MMSLSSIINELIRLTDLETLVGTYQTLASTSMQRIRSSVLANRAFHEGLNDVFHTVKRAHEKELARFRKNAKPSASAGEGARTQLRKGNAFVFLSANTGLYGDVVARTFERFLWVTRKEEGSYIVVGKIGKALFEEKLKGVAYRYFDFPDNRVDLSALSAIAKTLADFEGVTVVYEVFKSFLSQEPVTSNISGDLPPTGEAEVEVRYLIEPDLATVAAFFEKEIFSSLLEQTFNESRLAKLASRMMLLERSGQRISHAVKGATFQRQHIRHQAVNKKQVNALSGVALWEVVSH